MDILDVVNAIEKKYPVNQWAYNGIHLWPILRIKLIEENISLSSDKTVRISIAKKIHNVFLGIWKNFFNILRLIYYFWVDRSHSEKIHRSDIILFSDNADRIIKTVSLEFADQNLDGIKVGLIRQGYDIFSIENMGIRQQNFPRYTNSDISFIFTKAKIYLKQKMHLNAETPVIPHLDSVCKYIDSVGLERQSLRKDNIYRCGYYLFCFSEFFYRVLLLSESRLGILMCWYGIAQMGFNNACRRLNIPIVDVQHGLAGANGHRAYCRWQNVPAKGYNVMPTNFWCWSFADKMAIDDWNGQSDVKESAFVGGIPSRLLVNIGFISEEDKKTLTYLTEGKIAVLLSLQFGTLLPEWLMEYILTSESYGIIWFIRKHPTMDEVQAEILDRLKVCKNVEIKLSSQLPLDIVLNYVNFHVTSHSSVVLNAINFGIKSAVVCRKALEFFRGQVENGECFWAENANSLDAMIKKIANNGNMKHDDEILADDNIEVLARIIDDN